MTTTDFKDFKSFKATVLKSIELSENFKIVCRGEDEAALAQHLGTLSKASDGVTIVQGRTDENLIGFFKRLNKPEKESDRLMPFYEIILDDKIYFENYGKNNCIK